MVWMVVWLAFTIVTTVQETEVGCYRREFIWLERWRFMLFLMGKSMTTNMKPLPLEC